MRASLASGAAALDSDVSSARFVAVLGVTAVLFFICLLPFELVPEIPVDIDSKPFFVPLALSALLPAKRAGLAIGLGVALGEGMRDLMEGYELDDPIGFFGYIFGFWAASWVFAIAPRNSVVLVSGAIICALIQSCVEATSFLLFGSEGIAVAVESAIGNTITHGIIWGAIPLLFLVPTLRGKFESYLGFELRGAQTDRLPEVASTGPEPSKDSLAWIRNASFRYAGVKRPGIVDVSLEIGEGEVLGLAGGTPEESKTLALLLAGLAPGATGGAFSGESKAPDSVTIVSHRPSEYFTETRAIHQVVAAALLGGGDVEDAYARASALLSELGLAPERHTEYVWTLTEDEQGLTMIAAAILRQPQLIVAERLSTLFGDQTAALLRRLHKSLPDTSALLVLDDLDAELEAVCDRIIPVEGLGLNPDALKSAASPVERLRATAGDCYETDRDDSPVEIPTLQKDRGGWWRFRDPRLKWAMF